MTEMARFGVSQVRIEDDRFLTGKGRYIDDMVVAGMAHAALVRSDRAHARITSIDTGAAKAASGVLMVVTGAEWVAAGYKPIPTKNPVKKFRDGRPFGEPSRHCLAVDAVRHVGEPVVLVVAETRDQALAAAELVTIGYDELGSVVEPKAASADAAPEIWNVAPGNQCVDFELGNRADVEAAFAEADHVVTLEVVNNRVTSAPMEPRGCLAEWDEAAGQATIWNSSQNIHANRDVFAAMLGIEPAKLRHVAPDVGGGFGAKNCLYPEPPLLVHAARRLGRPVKWVATRTESFLSDAHGRDQISDVSLALDKEGTFLALKVSTLGNIGACCGTMGPFTPTNGTARTQGGPYAFKAMLYEAKAIFTNTVQTDPYRGAGRPEASFHIERIVEHAARTLGFDPVELRRKNLIAPEQLPWKTPMGLLVDSGNFAVVLDQTLKLAGYDGLGARKQAAKARGKRLGFAIAPYLECSGGQPTEEARVAFKADGTITLGVGSQSTGMGHETALSQILAARLGLPIGVVRYAQADTSLTKIGGGHGGSRGIELGGNTVMKAADTIERKAKVIAAHLLNSRPDDIGFEAGILKDTQTGQSLTIREVIAASRDASRLPSDMPGPAPDASALDTVETYERQQITVPNGCHAAEVEIDPETGFVAVTGFWAVDDFGRIVNPMLADGQVMGGIAQGLGQALLEEVVYDPDSGQLITASFMDYTMPRADDMPPLEIAYYEGAPTKHNAIGSKGAGEAGCCGAPPAIVNAVIDAVSEWGVTHIDMPVTPEKVWRAINGIAAR